VSGGEAALTGNAGSTDPLAAVPSFALGRIPRITFGAATFARVPEIVAGHGTRVLLVTGGHSLASSGRRDQLLEGLAATGLAVVGEVAVTDEPSPAVVDGAVHLNRDAAADVVLAVGGGSVLDAAKAIAGLLRSGESVVEHLEGLEGYRSYEGTPVPLVAVPTTAGTGSEATRNAVVTHRGPGGYKRSFRDERLVAADAVIDPDLLAGADPIRIAANGMDAVTQLMESYVSLRAMPVTDALAIAGLEAARDGLLAWHADPEGAEAPAARSRMAYAALLGGVTLAHAGLGGVHGLASPLGAQLPIPHGIACGTTLAGVTAANVAALEARDPGSPALARYATLGRLLARLPEATPDAAARAALVDTLRAWTAALAIPGLAHYGLDEVGIPAVVADGRGSSMKTNPVVLTDDELGSILREAL
jgi:alcohol dehydrogenase class IV